VKRTDSSVAFASFFGTGGLPMRGALTVHPQSSR
jgi:hypothetical protein